MTEQDHGSKNVPARIEQPAVLSRRDILRQAAVARGVMSTRIGLQTLFSAIARIEAPSVLAPSPVSLAHGVASRAVSKMVSGGQDHAVAQTESPNDDQITPADRERFHRHPDQVKNMQRSYPDATPDDLIRLDGKLTEEEILMGELFGDYPPPEEVMARGKQIGYPKPINAEPSTAQQLSTQDSDREIMNKMFSGLEPTEVEVIRARFGLDDGKSLSLKATAKKFNIKPAEVKRIEHVALSKLRANNGPLVDYLT